MDSVLSLDEEAPDQKKEKSLPPHITTPKRGPLLLQKLQQATKLPQTELPSCLKDKRHHLKHQPQSRSLKSGVRVCAPVRRGFLTRYPVVVTPQPMDVIEDHLLKEEMTWSQLKYNVQQMMEDGRGLTAKKEGYNSDESAFLHHRMKYSSHGNDPLLAIERYTHSMSSANDPSFAGPGTIDVSITCSRIPQKHELRQTSVLPTQQSLLTITTLSTSEKIWRGSSNVQKTHRSRPVSRASDKAVYLTNGVIKTDNHGKSTSLPQRATLVQHAELNKAIAQAQYMSHTDLPHTQQINQSSATHKQQDYDTRSSAMVGEGEITPSKSLRVYLSSHDGPSIAPAGVRAVATHRLRPVTSNTMIKGKSLVTVAR